MQVDIFWLGEQVAQCDACRSCKRGGFCKTEDSVNNFVRIAGNYDGYLFVSPVYYASISSQMDAFLTRLFYSNPKLMMYKPVAGITVSRRSGNTSAFSRMNMYFLMHSMIVVGSQYWNEIYCNEDGDYKEDAEGMQTIATLIENMKYVIEGLLP
jgi:multimeric flavodoxin WrbA